MKILIIGGTGTISTEVVKKSIEIGYDVTLLNRGYHNQNLPIGVKVIVGDINDEPKMHEMLNNYYFDVVVEFVGFKRHQVERDIRLFTGITKQYIYISSASAYQKPVVDYPITEKTPLVNPYWEYSRDKIACEEFLRSVDNLAVTIVRPSHTYDARMIMAPVTRWQFEYAHLKRLKEGKPVIIPGDGTNVWTITHAKDFANSFVYLFGNELAYNEVFHITSEILYTWDMLTEITAKALGVEPKIIHIPSDFIISKIPELEGSLLGDKSWSAIFDNSKIKSISKEYSSKIRYEDVIDDVIKYYEANKDKQVVSDDFEEAYDNLIEEYLQKQNNQPI